MATALKSVSKPVYFKIIKNVPLANSQAGRPNLYPFDQMQVGDAFDVPRDLGNAKYGKNIADVRRNRLAAAASNYGKRNAMKFATRVINEDTVRCWRVA